VVRRQIFVIATDAAGCFLYRLHHPLNAINQDEFEVIWNPPNGTQRPGAIVIGQRIAGRNTAWLEMCADPNLFCVYDIDDNLLEIDPANTIPYRIFHPQVKDTTENIAAAQLVTVSTPKLAARLQAVNPNVVVLRNYIPRTWLSPPRSNLVTGQIVVGWAGSPFHDQDFGGVGEQLRTFVDLHPGRVRFHVIGGDPTRGIVARHVSPFIGMDAYRDLLDFSIGIAPLTMNPQNDSKSWIKVLEYAGRGIPAIAANVGQYAEFIEHGVDGFLYENVSELSRYLTIMADDERRSAMSAAALEKVADLTIDQHAQKWAQAYRELG
jgi:glycosyltransferase involved in cell wall biosynthesis